MSGFHNLILQVDLSSGRQEEISLPGDYWQDYIGGSTLAARLFADTEGPMADPLSAANPLLVMTGPMVGTNFPGSSRFVMCARSPLTGIWGESASGGFFGAQLKKTGFDGIVFLGKCDRPSYLVVENGRAKLMDAGDLWGLDTYECINRLNLDMRWGNIDAAIGLVKKIAQREGIGETAALGNRAMADHVQGSAADYAVTVKGMELPMHDPRAFHGLGLAYMNSNRGACHLPHTVQAVEQGMVAWPQIGLAEDYPATASSGKAKMVAICENIGQMANAACVCQFVF